MKVIKITHPGRDWNDISSNPDREYMEMCGKIDRNRPAEWKEYGENPFKIVNMEYQKLIEAKTKPEIITSLYRLSVACLNYWRNLK